MNISAPLALIGTPIAVNYLVYGTPVLSLSNIAIPAATLIGGSFLEAQDTNASIAIDPSKRASSDHIRLLAPFFIAGTAAGYLIGLPFQQSLVLTGASLAAFVLALAQIISKKN